MSRTVLPLLAAVSLGFAPAPFLKHVRPGPAAADLRALRGEWSLVKEYRGGFWREGDFDESAVFADGSLTLRFKNTVTNRLVIACIDPKANPKRMEVRIVGDDDPPTRIRCIDS